MKGMDLISALYGVGGFYECPYGPDGKRHGPLVGYTGRYDAGDGTRLQFVGDVYANCARLERRPDVLMQLATELSETTGLLPAGREEEHITFCGAPMGGLSLAKDLAYINGDSYIFPEKKVRVAETSTSREVADLVWGRHEVERGEQVVIVEDVCNNFSTTKQLVELIEEAGASVISIVCLLNRSPSVEVAFSFEGHAPIPVVAYLRMMIQEWRQDDPAVAEDVAANNVVWKPKDKESWKRLMLAMER